MPISRRSLLTGSLLTAFAAPAAARAQQPAAAPKGLDAARYGVRANAETEQTRALQKAIDETARAQQPLWLAPGRYRTGPLTLPSGGRIAGQRGATRLILAGGGTLLQARGGSDIALSGVTLEGAAADALADFTAVASLRIADCDLKAAKGNGLTLTQCTGTVSGNTIADCGDNGVMSLDSKLTLRANTIQHSGNGGIRVWRSSKASDGSVIEDNVIEDTAARAGGDGQNGNAINVYRAADVIVRDNVIRRAAFTAIRGNAASRITMTGNQCLALGEVAIYSEFEFEDATIERNLIDVAAVGIAVTNMDKGGHGAMVRGNVIRNMINKRPQGGPDSYGVGIGVEADTEVSGNTIENAPVMGIEVGSGQYLRNVTVTRNTLRRTGIGIGVTVVEGAGKATISDNVIAEAKGGAVVGMRWDKAATGDLTRGGADKFPNLTIRDNKVG
ncbi:MAG: TIGR03808 family TAT-translocated repetitive protein [Proteobacteria bacterium]|nr:TIGR03808 family TAT-translocated repetitive protein [Pseudomonadota bacterium]